MDRLVKHVPHRSGPARGGPGDRGVTTMVHHVLEVTPEDKARLTAEIAGRDGRTVIFVRTQRGADRVAQQLRGHGVLAGALHGGLAQGARTRVLGAFRDGSLPVLVATDVAARGHPRRRHRPGAPGGPARRFEGVSAPLGPDRSRRRDRHGRHARAAAPAPGGPAADGGGRRTRHAAPRRDPEWRTGRGDRCPSSVRRADQCGAVSATDRPGSDPPPSRCRAPSRSAGTGPAAPRGGSRAPRLGELPTLRCASEGGRPP